ncbi:hypothetical protein U9M48_032497 [Paspalum notatum var. saurae]|uniref:No apical meristem-associated C-terminal domain-containing protein n=1 Tax=Paspalum notatum var. saurae TaxID=547442 RepID=A0AAQ3X4W1_PASNO
MDPTVGTNQTYESFWDRVTNYYEEHKGSYSSRSKKSLQHRWDSINTAVSKFVGIKAQQDRLKKSGETKNDRLEKSKAIFEAGKGKQKWVFQHCWEALRHSKKWENHRLNREGEGDDLEALNLGNNSVEPSDSKRPMGRDSAKKRKSGTPDESGSQCLEVLQQMAKTGELNCAAMAAAQAERSANHRAKMQIMQQTASSQNALSAAVVAKEKRKQFEHDMAIMDKDLDAMSGPQRHFYIEMQKRILSKYGINNANGASD